MNYLHRFNPERFLVRDNGKTHFKHHPKVTPFGTGKRKCLGEALAKAQLYLFFTRLMQRYNVVKVNEDINLDEGGCDGFINYPQDYAVQFVPRGKRY